ncbi:MAG: response regulator [Chloroflexi bacterium]|nr:response regulator [Chloroflexota bacterium]
MVREKWRAGFTRNSDIEFRELLERLPAAAYTTDADGLITWFNQYAVDVWGREPRLNDPEDRFCGSFRLFHIDGEPMQHAECWMGLALRDRHAYNGHEVVIERQDGSRRVALAHANPIFDGDVLVGAVNVLMDITDRKHAELELQEASEAKTRFLAVLAHELRNPLAPMRNAFELMQRGGDEPAVQRAHATLDRQLRHLTRIVDDLLDVARITRGSLELRRSRVQLAPILSQAAETARPLIEPKGQRLEVHIPGEPIVVDGDPVRLAQLIGNLLANASKYSDAGKNIDLRVERMGSDVIVSVLDEGIGIPAEALPTIFEMFSSGTASSSQDGLGVGLTLARQLAEMHGGFIEVRSAGAGAGSEFRVHLPAVLDMREPAVTGPAEPQRTRAPTGRRVLVVDDNRDAANSLSELLRVDGYETRVAHDGAAAVELAESWGPEVILLDIGLPRLDGYEAARRIRALERGSEIRLIAVTGWGQAEDRAKSAAAGFDHHLVKPVDLPTLSELFQPIV